MTKLERLKLLREKWKTIDPKTVDLEDWFCGTHACLAGHASRIPEFQAEGFLNPCGVPTLESPTTGTLVGYAACKEFFGRHDIFSPRGDGCEYDKKFGEGFVSDYEVAEYRLDRAIEDYQSFGDYDPREDADA